MPQYQLPLESYKDWVKRVPKLNLSVAVDICNNAGVEVVDRVIWLNAKGVVKREMVFTIDLIDFLGEDQ